MKCLFPMQHQNPFPVLFPGLQLKILVRAGPLRRFHHLDMVVLFFPGTYTEQELILFNEIKDDNYYRAFKLVK